MNQSEAAGEADEDSLFLPSDEEDEDDDVEEEESFELLESDFEAPSDDAASLASRERLRVP